MKSQLSLEELQLGDPVCHVERKADGTLLLGFVSGIKADRITVSWKIEGKYFESTVDRSRLRCLIN